MSTTRQKTAIPVDDFVKNRVYFDFPIGTIISYEGIMYRLSEAVRYGSCTQCEAHGGLCDMFKCAACLRHENKDAILRITDTID